MIYVVGCNHGMQPRDADWLAGDTDAAAEQKEHFAKLVEETIKADNTQFVGEEWGLASATKGQVIADKCGMPWFDFNTCFHDLDRLGIPRNYVNGNYAAEEKNLWNRKRERVMVDRIKARIKENRKGILICGFEHMDPLVELLRTDSMEAQPVDYRKKDWYRRTFSGDS